MKHEDWLDIMRRLPAGQLVELAWEGQDRRMLSPCEIVPSGLEPQGFAPSARLWPLSDTGIARFGVRVRSAPDEVLPAAARLCAAAIERATAPVILSHVDRCGFEAIGFRVERIAGRTQSEIQCQEDEVAAFWNLSIVIDLDDISHMH